MDDRSSRLILAYLVVACGVAALVGMLVGERDLVRNATGLAILIAALHSVSFLIRTRRRKAPAVLLGASRPLLMGVLGAIAAAVTGNLITVLAHMGPEGAESKYGGDPVSAAAAVGWTLVILVLCWRVWIHPSARRAAVLQVGSLVIGLPGLLVGMLKASGDRHHYLDRTAVDTAFFVTFIVIAAAGPALDKLFASVTDRSPADANLPEAIVR